MPAKFLSTEEVSAETGATLRQLQWWDEQGILPPTGKIGKDRRYSQAQAGTIGLLVAFRHFGIPPRRALRYIEAARDREYAPGQILRYLHALESCGLRVR